MKTITVKIEIEPQIYDAAKEFMEEKGVKIEQELAQSVKKCYMKYVPAAVRKYIEKTSSIASPFISAHAEATASEEQPQSHPLQNQP